MCCCAGCPVSKHRYLTSKLQLSTNNQTLTNRAEVLIAVSTVNLLSLKNLRCIFLFQTLFWRKSTCIANTSYFIDLSRHLGWVLQFSNLTWSGELYYGLTCCSRKLWKTRSVSLRDTGNDAIFPHHDSWCQSAFEYLASFAKIVMFRKFYGPQFVYVYFVDVEEDVCNPVRLKLQFYFVVK